MAKKKQPQQQLDNSVRHWRGLVVPPEDLVIVEDPESVFYDHREHDPKSAKFRNLVEAIKQNGVIGEIEVAPYTCPDGKERYAIIDGRRRCRGFMVARDELIAAGKPLPGSEGAATKEGKVNIAIWDDLTPEQIRDRVVAANQQRPENTPQQEIHQMTATFGTHLRAARAEGMSDAASREYACRRTAINWGQSVLTVKRKLLVPKLPPEAREKFYKGKLPLAQIDVLMAVPTESRGRAAEAIEAAPMPPMRRNEGRDLVTEAGIPLGPTSDAGGGPRDRSDPNREVKPYVARRPKILAAREALTAATDKVDDPAVLKRMTAEFIDYILGLTEEPPTWLAPAKSETAANEAADVANDDAAEKPKRGRKPKAQPEPAPEPAAEVRKPPRRGRKPKTTTAPDATTEPTVTEDSQTLPLPGVPDGEAPPSVEPHVELDEDDSQAEGYVDPRDAFAAGVG